MSPTGLGKHSSSTGWIHGPSRLEVLSQHVHRQMCKSGCSKPPGHGLLVNLVPQVVWCQDPEQVCYLPSQSWCLLITI